MREEEKGGESCRLRVLNEWGADFLGSLPRKDCGGFVRDAMK
ncbi:hypothetical protein RBSWK_01007 [Rhodopirellula baltica SWK14]|uniref:Uncharacterized protein n=1 Tax=Rhodopirellula baltica SWK14 TaxID=993516 RepID=L7CN21_RHOBT|nr:hypothetical protein RBSWK_01007 [Rhodopirellula baltica SWK14]